MKYRLIEDPGHGWLEVTKQELINLGIEKKISPYSYQRGNLVYLEEDCDLAEFAKVKGWPNDISAFVKVVYEENTPIRNYAHYHNLEYVSPYNQE